MRPNVYENKEEGIKCVYTNEKWLVSIKNWKPDNDIEGLKHLEIHHTTDEQFILVNGKAILITAERKDGKFETELTLMEKGKVYNVPKECWFYSITQKDTKMVYVQDSGCSMENSDFCDLSEEEIKKIPRRSSSFIRLIFHRESKENRSEAIGDRKRSDYEEKICFI